MLITAGVSSHDSTLDSLCNIQYNIQHVKGEKNHHSIAHYANGRMRPALVDALTFAGMANDNLRLLYNHDVLCFEIELRVEIPYEFRRVPPHLNHSRLDYINKKTRACDGIKRQLHLRRCHLQHRTCDSFRH